MDQPISPKKPEFGYDTPYWLKLDEKNLRASFYTENTTEQILYDFPCPREDDNEDDYNGIEDEDGKYPDITWPLKIDIFTTFAKINNVPVEDVTLMFDSSRDEMRLEVHKKITREMWEEAKNKYEEAQDKYNKEMAIYKKDLAKYEKDSINFQIEKAKEALEGLKAKKKELK